MDRQVMKSRLVGTGLLVTGLLSVYSGHGYIGLGLGVFFGVWLSGLMQAAQDKLEGK